jgi:hypothetical protein
MSIVGRSVLVQLQVAIISRIALFQEEMMTIRSRQDIVVHMVFNMVMIVVKEAFLELKRLMRHKKRL